MGVDVGLIGDDFDLLRWRREVGRLLVEGERLRLLPLSGLVLEQEGGEVILFEGDEVRDLGEGDSDWLLGEGGIRGVTVKWECRELILRMPSGVSGGDWELVTVLAEVGLDCGAVVTVDGEVFEGRPLDFGSVRDEFWALSVGAFRRAVEDSGSGCEIPVLHEVLHLEIDEADVVRDDLEEVLVERMTRYASAHWASDLHLEKEGRERVVNVAGRVPTMVSLRADGVFLCGDPTCDEVGLFGGKPVPMGVFVNAMGDRVERAGPRLYVPVIDFEADGELMRELDPSSGFKGDIPLPGVGRVEPIYGSGKESGERGPDAGVLEAGLHVLARAPVMIFLMVAAADGKVDAKEVDTFKALLVLSPLMKSKVLGQVMMETAGRVDVLVEEVIGNADSLVEMLAETLAVLQWFEDDEQVLVRQGLYGLGEEIARASGGFFGMGSRISRKERRVLKGLAEILGVEG